MNLKQLSGKSARRICDETQEIKKNKVNSMFKYVIDAGGLEGFDDIRWRYTAGVYGWNADVFDIDYLKVAVVSGYRPFGNVKAPNDLINEYNEKVKSVRGWEQKKELLREFAYAVLAAKGIFDSRKVSDGLNFINLFEELELTFGGCDCNRNVAQVYVHDKIVNVELSVDQIAYIYTNSARTADDVVDIDRSEFVDDDSFINAVIDAVRSIGAYGR